MACFADINVSQGIVATYRYARYGGIFNIDLSANLLRNLGKFFNRLRFDRSMVMSVAPLLWSTLYILVATNADRATYR